MCKKTVQRSFIYAFFLSLSEREKIFAAISVIVMSDEKVFIFHKNMQEHVNLTNLSAQVELLATQIRKNDEEIIYDLTDLMRILKVSRRTLFTWISEGILPTKMLGKKHYISKRDLMALIEGNPALQKGGRHE